jgi:hypothetical protein
MISLFTSRIRECTVGSNSFLCWSCRFWPKEPEQVLSGVSGHNNLLGERDRLPYPETDFRPYRRPRATRIYRICRTARATWQRVDHAAPGRTRCEKTGITRTLLATSIVILRHRNRPLIRLEAKRGLPLPINNQDRWFPRRFVLPRRHTITNTSGKEVVTRP